MRQAVPLCSEGYFYAACKTFPRLQQVGDKWYEHQDKGQLEFRKYEQSMPSSVREYYKAWNEGKMDMELPKDCWNPYSKWIVTPCWYLEEGEETFPEFEMEDLDVLSLWIEVIKRGGCVSDGVINLFESY